MMNYIKVSIPISIISIYYAWKSYEMYRISLLSKEFVKNGYIKLKTSITLKQKRKAWIRILQDLLRHWTLVLPKTFDINDNNTWPKNKKLMKLSTMKSKVNHVDIPSLIDDNYEIQAILCYLHDEHI